MKLSSAFEINKIQLWDPLSNEDRLLRDLEVKAEKD
jgi:hypothetical protein